MPRNSFAGPEFRPPLTLIGFPATFVVQPLSGDAELILMADLLSGVFFAAVSFEVLFDAKIVFRRDLEQFLRAVEGRMADEALASWKSAGSPRQPG